jgi:predicted Zn-dependent protease
MGDQQLKVCARYVGLRCSESEKVEADILGIQVIERAGYS